MWSAVPIYRHDRCRVAVVPELTDSKPYESVACPDISAIEV